MERASRCGVTAAITLAVSKMVRRKAEESTSGPMEVSIQATGLRMR